MESTQVIELVTQVGFPIVACIALFYLYDKSIKGFMQTLSKMETLLEDVSDFIKTIEREKNES